MTEPLALYVHWPFCVSKCPYCDFNSHVRERVDQARWANALLAELRAAFRESLCQQVDRLGRARCDGNWEVAAMRLKGLAASFHVDPLIVLADEALAAAPGDPVVLRKFRAALDEFAA